MTEKNELNIYNHLETIRKAVDELETIHVYEVNSRAYGSSKEDELRSQVVDLEKQVLNYELQLAQLQDEIDQKASTVSSLLSANNKLIEQNKLANDNIELIKQQADKIAAMYENAPKVVKKLYNIWS